MKYLLTKTIVTIIYICKGERKHWQSKAQSLSKDMQRMMALAADLVALREEHGRVQHRLEVRTVGGTCCGALLLCYHLILIVAVSYAPGSGSGEVRISRSHAKSNGREKPTSRGARNGPGNVVLITVCLFSSYYILVVQYVVSVQI